MRWYSASDTLSSFVFTLSRFSLMGHTWLVSTVSVATFLLSAVLVVTSGPAQEPLGEARRSQIANPQSGHRGKHIRLKNRHKEASRSKSDDPSLSETLLRESVVQVPTGYQSSYQPGYQPREEVYLADPSNYGERLRVDAAGQLLNNDYIVVLHETVGSVSSALNLFLTHHPHDDDQVSYHTLIGLDGTVYYVVPPEQRAFGAGNSVFRTASGDETVVTNPEFASSVNNFAYHISLETPLDGQNSSAIAHSGYTAAQYQSLAWLLSRTTVSNERITTHREVDRSGARIDPRSFEFERLAQYLSQYSSQRALK